MAFICQFASGSNLAVGSLREPGEVDHAVDAVERAGGDVADVRLDELDPVDERGERLAPQ